jgi:hypothetical protein
MPMILSQTGIQSVKEEVVKPDAATSNVFCQDWPVEKKVLQALQNLWKNPIANIIIGLVIEAGDAIQGKICH